MRITRIVSTSPFWNKRHFAEEVIRIAVLYYVLFVLDDDARFEKRFKDFLDVFAGNDPDAKVRRLRQLSRRLLQRDSSQQEGTRPQLEIPVEHARTALEKISAMLRSDQPLPLSLAISFYKTACLLVEELDDWSKAVFTPRTV